MALVHAVPFPGRLQSCLRQQVAQRGARGGSGMQPIQTSGCIATHAPGGIGDGNQCAIATAPGGIAQPERLACHRSPAAVLRQSAENGSPVKQSRRRVKMSADDRLSFHAVPEHERGGQRHCVNRRAQRQADAKVSVVCLRIACPPR